MYINLNFQLFHLLMKLCNVNAVYRINYISFVFSFKIQQLNTKYHVGKVYIYKHCLANI